MKKLLTLLLFLSFGSSVLFSKVTLPRLFSDNMVLQRDVPISVWGKASKGSLVSLQFNGQEIFSRVNGSGEWVAELVPMTAGGPFTMKVMEDGSKDAVVLNNILVGDVWICSGQSNMEWPLKDTENAREEIAASANSRIRLLTVEKTIELKELSDLKAGVWQECDPATVPDFSAVSYYFGKEIEAGEGVPVGLINTSWGGTDIQTWTSWKVMQQIDPYRRYAGKSVAESFAFNPKNLENYQAALKKDPGTEKRWYLQGTNTADWKSMYVPGLWEGDLAEEDGIVWFRKEILLPASVSRTGATLCLGKVDDVDYTYVNGEFVGYTREYNQDRIYSLHPGALWGGVNTIVVKVQDTGGGGGIYGKPEEVYIEADGVRYPLSGNWLYKPSVLTSHYNVRQYGPNSFASLLFNGMIKPLTKYRIKGAIWYQGENNAHEAYKYRKMFPDMILDWRKQWGSEFPFIWVQLANFMKVQDEPVESAWAELREAQNLTLQLPQTGQAVITDIGDADDIHPRNKKDVGHRLALNALKLAYGRDIVASGPEYESMEISGDRVILNFRNAQGLGLKEHNPYGYLYGFSIAGADRKFVWAKAYIDGDKVVVFSEKVKSPEAVRYGWADNPGDCNLVNGAGLLASPFRTDDWPGITRK